eukprot:tig00000863_g5004.t1
MMDQEEMMEKLSRLERFLEREKRELDALPKVDPRSLPRGQVVAGMLESRSLKISYLGIRDVKSLLLFFFFEDRPWMQLLLFGMMLCGILFSISVVRLVIRMRHVRPMEAELKAEEVCFTRLAILAQKAELGRRMAKQKDEQKRLDDEIDKQSDLAEKSADRIDEIRARMDRVPKALTWPIGAGAALVCALGAAAAREAFRRALRAKALAAEELYLAYLERCGQRNAFAADPDWLVSLWTPGAAAGGAAFGMPPPQDGHCGALEADLSAANPGLVWGAFAAAMAPAELARAAREAAGLARAPPPTSPSTPSSPPSRCSSPPPSHAASSSKAPAPPRPATSPPGARRQRRRQGPRLRLQRLQRSPSSTRTVAAAAAPAERPSRRHRVQLKKE